jgi:hypothetical protein
MNHLIPLHCAKPTDLTLAAGSTDPSFGFHVTMQGSLNRAIKMRFRVCFPDYLIKNGFSVFLLFPCVSLFSRGMGIFVVFKNIEENQQSYQLL